MISTLVQQSICLLAQAEAGGAPAGGDASPGGGIAGMFPAIALSLLAMYFIMIRPEKKREKDLKAQLESLKKNDRVVTVGGIYGVVTNVKRESDEVTLKIDEETNTKMRVTFRSIARIVGPATDGPQDSTKA